MSNTPQTKQPPPNGQQPLTWEAIGKLSKAEYLARRDEIQQWMKKHVVSGRVIQ